MKKIITFCIATLLLAGASIAQRPVRDALILSSYLKNGKFGTDPKIDSIFALYFADQDETVGTTFEQNPFTKDYFNPALTRAGILPLSSLATSVGGLDVTNIADGLAKFLVERTKQELSIVFFEDFKKKLDDPRFHHLTVLFANTYSLLKTIDVDIYQFSSYIQALREAFMNDLDNLYNTFPVVVNDPAFAAFFNNNKPLKEILLYGLFITRELRSDVHPGQIIEDIDFTESDNAADATDLNAVLKSVQLISTSLKSSAENDKQYWVTKDSIVMLVKNKDAFQLYLGLLYAKAGGIKFSNGKTLQAYMEKSQEFIAHSKELVTMLETKVSEIEQVIAELKAQVKKDINYSDYFHYFQAVTGLFNISDQLNTTFKTLPFSSHYGTFVNVAGDVSNLFLDINKKNYAPGVMRLVSIYDSILRPAYTDQQFAAYKDFRKAVIKYGTFMAQVAQAENSDDVKTAIESVALPTGSASIKKHSSVNISLNAYVGPFYGSQKLASEKEAKSTFGVYSPVGFTLSTGLRTGAAPASLSLFFSVIDIGALTSFRFSDTSSLAGDVQVKLSQIVAPGIHAVLGFPRWPISLGVGHQWMPLLSKVEQDQAVLYDSKGTRWQVFLAVDIPMLNLFTRSR